MSNQHGNDHSEHDHDHKDHERWLADHRTWRIEHGKLLAGLRRVEAELHQDEVNLLEDVQIIAAHEAQNTRYEGQIHEQLRERHEAIYRKLSGLLDTLNKN